MKRFHFDSANSYTYLWIYYRILSVFLKWENCILCELYLNKAVQNFMDEHAKWAPSDHGRIRQKQDHSVSKDHENR